MSTTSMSNKFLILSRSGKYIFPLLLSSVLLTSGLALAQLSPSSDTEELSRLSLKTSAEAVISEPVSTPGSQFAQADDTVSSEQVLAPLNGTKRVSLELVKDSWLVKSFPANLLFPESARLKEWELQFDNRGSKSISVTVLNTAVRGQGKQTGFQLTSNDIYVSQEVTGKDEKEDSTQSAKSPPETDVNANDANQNSKVVLPANQIVSLPLTINLSTIPPDEYDGTIFLTLNDGQKMDLPLNMSVRTGPLIPLVVIVIGILLGLFSKYMEEKGDYLVKTLHDIRRLKLDIRAADNLSSTNEKKLLKEVGYVRNFADRLAFDVVKKRIENIKSFLIPTDEKKEESEASKASTLTNEKKEESEASKASTLTDEKKEESEASKIESEIQSLIERHFSEEEQKWYVFLLRLPDRVRSEAIFWLLKPFLSALLVIGLSTVGLNLLYINNKAFGAKPWPDYLSLIVWGLSADWASRRLTDLPGKIR